MRVGKTSVWARGEPIAILNSSLRSFRVSDVCTRVEWDFPRKIVTYTYACRRRRRRSPRSSRLRNKIYTVRKDRLDTALFVLVRFAQPVNRITSTYHLVFRTFATLRRNRKGRTRTKINNKHSMHINPNHDDGDFRICRKQINNRTSRLGLPCWSQRFEPNIYVYRVL